MLRPETILWLDRKWKILVLHSLLAKSKLQQKIVILCFLLVRSNLSVSTFQFPASFFVRLFPACVWLSLVWIAPLRLSGEVVFPTFQFWIVLKSFDLRIAWREMMTSASISFFFFLHRGLAYQHILVHVGWNDGVDKSVDTLWACHDVGLAFDVHYFFSVCGE